MNKELKHCSFDCCQRTTETPDTDDWTRLIFGGRIHDRYFCPEHAAALLATVKTRPTPRANPGKYGPKGIRPSGLIMAHNQVRRHSTSPHGANGFRRWFDWPPKSKKESRHFHQALPDYVICKCGWRQDLGVHYRIKGMGPTNYRCENLAAR